MTAFVDLPARTAEPFWSAVTGCTLSARRGEREEFATLVPADGDAHLRVQTVAAGPGGCHLDLHVDDFAATAERAVRLGASVRAELDDVVVLGSPGGFGWCLVGHQGERTRTRPVRWPGGHRSLVDQLCLDIPASRYDAECSFWSALTGWEHRHGRYDDFSALAGPESMPLRLLLQRTRDDDGPVRAHLDLACDDVEAEVRRHLGLGATIVRWMPVWTTLRDPAGLDYCVTGRDPDTGRLSASAGG
jgi:Glyoxalase-like domain